METDTLVINVSGQGIGAADLEAELSELNGHQPGLEIRLPRPAPGGLPMLDPGTIQIGARQCTPERPPLGVSYFTDFLCRIIHVPPQNILGISRRSALVSLPLRRRSLRHVAANK
jgi:hypothetical protein